MSSNLVVIGASGSIGSAVIKRLKQLYPNAKEDELDMLVELNTKDDLKAVAEQLGWSDKEIKEAFK